MQQPRAGSSDWLDRVISTVPTSIFTGIVIFAFMAVYNGFNDSNKEFRTDIKETVARLEQKVDKRVDNFESKLNSLTDTVDNIDVKVNGVICGYFLAIWLVTRPEGKRAG